MKIIPLSQGLIALVSDEDFKYLSQWKWYAAKTSKNGNYYARRLDHKSKKLIYMHRVITNAPTGLEPDHKNHNTLDNRRENLVLGTHYDNMQNPNPAKIRRVSGYKGVRLFEGRYWRAQIHIDGKFIHLGSFKSPEAAAKAYDAAAKKYGKDKYLNFPG